MYNFWHHYSFKGCGKCLNKIRAILRDSQWFCIMFHGSTHRPMAHNQTLRPDFIAPHSAHWSTVHNQTTRPAPIAHPKSCKWIANNAKHRCTDDHLEPGDLGRRTATVRALQFVPMGHLPALISGLPSSDIYNCIKDPTQHQYFLFLKLSLLRALEMR